MSFSGGALRCGFGNRLRRRRRIRRCGGLRIVRHSRSDSVGTRTSIGTITAVAEVPAIPGTTITIAIWAALVTLLFAARFVAGSILRRRRRGRTLALEVFRRALETAQLLAQGIKLALISLLLALDGFEQFQNLVQCIERFAEGGDDGHHVIHGSADARGLRGLERAGQRFMLRCGSLLLLRLRRGGTRLLGAFANLSIAVAISIAIPAPILVPVAIAFAGLFAQLVTRGRTQRRQWIAATATRRWCFVLAFGFTAFLAKLGDAQFDVVRLQAGRGCGSFWSRIVVLGVLLSALGRGGKVAFVVGTALAVALAGILGSVRRVVLRDGRGVFSISHVSGVQIGVGRGGRSGLAGRLVRAIAPAATTAAATAGTTASGGRRALGRRRGRRWVRVRHHV